MSQRACPYRSADRKRLGPSLTKQLLFDGVAVEVNTATVTLEGFLTKLADLSEKGGLGCVVVDEVNRIIEAMYDGEKSALKAADTIGYLGTDYQQFSGLLGQIALVIKSASAICAWLRY